MGKTVGIIGTIFLMFSVVGATLGVRLFIGGFTAGDFLGAIITFALGYFIVFLSIVFSNLGWVLILASLYSFSKVYSESGIFRRALLSTILYIVGTIIGTIVIFGRGFFSKILGVPEGDFIGVAPYSWLVFFVLASYFIYRSLSLLAARSGKTLFRTAGILLLASACLLLLAGIVTAAMYSIGGQQTVISMRNIIISTIFIGLFLEFISLMALAIAFYTVKPPQYWRLGV